ncbi:hypothetical protein B0H14DRAFT_3502115 [Mycena olivaceomarginata]|nr:hypothetical protein B0H14DRAFT_3502115 [Mycena olivaceomarginata]
MSGAWGRGKYETPKVNGAKRARTDSMSDDGQAEKKRVKLPGPYCQGNLTNAESLLKDLIEENVVVEKLVYDNDAPVVPVAVVKNTRSKAKNKS